VALYLALSQVFPTGRLPDGDRWRRLAAGLLAAAWVVLALTAFGPAISFPSDGSAGLMVPNRLALLGWLPGLDLIPPDLLFAPLLVLLLVGILAMLVRYRRSSGIVRLQLRWLVAAVGFVALAVLFGLAAITVFGEGIGLLAWLPAIVAYPSVPAAVAVAVLRYRLYDIDRIISRTISWALLTATLLAAFTGGLLSLQAALAGVTQGETFAVAASTLLAFALVQPIRRRIQSAVDRRFHRARYDAQRTADGFANLVRHQVDLGRIEESLVQTADRAVRPVGTSLWLRHGAEAPR
jgi:hypothetical protein